MYRAILPIAAALTFVLAVPAVEAAEPPAVTVTLPIGHAVPANVMAYSPDGRFLLAGDDANQIKLWDATSGELVRNYIGHTSGIDALTFSSDGDYFASGGLDDTVRIWNVATGKQLTKIDGFDSSISAVAFSRDGLMLAAGDRSGRTILTDFSGTAKSRTAEIGYAVKALKIDAAKDELIVAGDDGVIHIFSLDDALTEVSQDYGPRGLSVGAAAFLPGTTEVVFAEESGPISLWDYDTGDMAMSFAVPARANTWLMPFPDGKRFLSSTEVTQDDGGPIAFWDVATGAEQKRVDFGADVLAIAPDGKTLALADRKGIWIEDAETGAVIRTFADRTPAADFQSATADGGQALATFPAYGKMVLWNVGSGAPIRTFPDAGGPAWLSPDGAHIAGTADPSGRGEIRLWDTDSGETIATFNIGNGEVRAVSWNADGKIAAVLIDGSMVRTVNLAALDTLGTGIPVDQARALAMAPDATSFAVADGIGTVSLYSLKDGSQVRQFKGLERGPKIAFSPDGKTLIGSDHNGTTMLWTVKTGAVAKKLAANTAAYRDGFSTDGTIAYVTGWDSSVRLWNLKTGKALPTLWADTPVDLVTFSGKGNTTAATILPTDATMRWSLKNGALLATTARFDDGAPVTVTPEGFFDGGDDAARALRLVHGRDVFALGDAAAVLRRPDLVAAKLVNDADAGVKKATAKLDLNAALGNATPIASEKESVAASTPQKATHVVVTKSMLRAGPDEAAAAGVELTPGTQVAVVEVKGTWSLVARDGNPIGYIASDALAPLQ